MRVTFTIKNYRCFPDSSPLRITLGSGPIALVGQNNAGKSSALRFFHEFRPLWNWLLDGTFFMNLESQRPLPSSLQDAGDPQDLFCNRNSRDMQIQIQLEQNNETRPSSRLSFINILWNKQGLTFTGELVLGDGSVHTTIQGTNPHQDVLVLNTGSGVATPGLFRTMKQLASCQYVPPYRSITKFGGMTAYGFELGYNFVSKWQELKVGSTKWHTRQTIEVQELIRSIFGFKSLEINADTKSNDLKLVIDGEPYSISEVGHGVAQFVVTVVGLLVLKPKSVLIDEPETGLHPALQLKYLSQVAAQVEGQVIFATHSIGLARSFADSILLFQRKETGVEVRPFETKKNYAEFLGELSFSTWRELGAKTVLLVEGVTEVRTVSQILRKLKKDQEVVILPMGGRELIKAGSALEIAELQRLGVDIAVLIDSEKDEEAAQLSTQRAEFLNECAALKFRTHVLKRRAIENYWNDQPIKQVFGQSYTCLAPYQKLESVSPHWSKSDNWRIAEASDLVDFEGTDLLDFLRSI